MQSINWQQGEVTLSAEAQRNLRILQEAEVRLIDWRHPEGEERLHKAADYCAEGIDGASMPRSVSGRNCRWPDGAADILESALASAVDYLAAWESARGSVNHGRGGSGYERPRVVVLNNYGAGLYCKGERRVDYFPAD